MLVYFYHSVLVSMIQMTRDYSVVDKEPTRYQNTCHPPVTWKTPSKETPARPKLGAGRFSANLYTLILYYHTAFAIS